MSHHQLVPPTETEPTVPSSFRRGRAVRRLLTMVAAVCFALLGVAGIAQADTINQTPGLHQTWTWGDCRFDVGFVPDRYSPWAAIGGSTAQCSSRHNISAVVYLKFNGSVVAQSNNGSWTSFTNAYGFGYDANGNARVLETPRMCGGGYWQTVMVIWIGGYGTTSMTSGSPDWVTTAC